MIRHAKQVEEIIHTFYGPVVIYDADTGEKLEICNYPDVEKYEGRNIDIDFEDYTSEVFVSLYGGVNLSEMYPVLHKVMKEKAANFDSIHLIWDAQDGYISYPRIVGRRPETIDETTKRQALERAAEEIKIARKNEQKKKREEVKQAKLLMGLSQLGKKDKQKLLESLKKDLT